MSRKPEQPESDDAKLFRQALDGVVPMAQENRIDHVINRPYASPRKRTPVPQAVADNLTDHGVAETSSSEFLRNGISRMILRKLRRGDWPVRNSLDLHGLNSDEARKLLLGFLRDALQHDMRCVRIVHGKGWHSGGMGILKSRARHWLTQIPEVLAFCEAPPQHGGGGAVLVLLKASARLG